MEVMRDTFSLIGHPNTLERCPRLDIVVAALHAQVLQHAHVAVFHECSSKHKVGARTGEMILQSRAAMGDTMVSTLIEPSRTSWLCCHGAEHLPKDG